jgi:hypothetical protein
MNGVQREPTLRCPHCGHGLYTVDDVARLTGQSARTLQRRLEAAAIPGAIRERVPGGFRWLVPLEAVQGRVAEALPPLLERLVPEFEAARAAETSRLDAERRRADGEAAIGARDADEALFRAFQRSREATDWFAELEGWVVDGDSAALLSALQRTGIDFRRALHARAPEERIAALDDLLLHLDKAVSLCRRYESSGSAEWAGTRAPCRPVTCTNRTTHGRPDTDAP